MRKTEPDNLEKDVIRARLLGYPSYGYYKADFPETKDVEITESIAVEADTSREMVECKECGKLFCPTRKGMIYCSKRCSARLIQRERYRKKIAQKQAAAT